MALQRDSRGILRLENCDRTKSSNVAADSKISALIAAESLITYTTVERQGRRAAGRGGICHLSTLGFGNLGTANVMTVL
jgi:hypothetical protein